MSKLSQANQALETLKDEVNKKWYPLYHLAAPVGWMNDPNGLCWFDGYYHVFYQHHPYSPIWGPMHWGHARSKDLVRWEHMPIALAPEGPEDKDGCFSGSAVVTGDELALIYTGHKYHGEECEENLYQVQCLAMTSDGEDIERQGTVIDTPVNVHHFRDPKVWKEHDAYYMVVGARVDDIGEVQLYRSDDLKQWSFVNTLAQASADMGYMWECPDFFQLGDKHILMFSPQGIEANQYDNRNIFQSGYMVGQWADDKSFNIEKDFVEMDHGHDFYAPQSFVAPDGRRIVFGWLSMWESPMPEREDNWAGMLTIPREVTLDANNRLRMNPIDELETLRGHKHEWMVDTLRNEAIVVEAEAESIEIQLDIDLACSNAEVMGLQLGKGLKLYVDSQSQRLVLARDYAQHKLVGSRSVALVSRDQLSLRVFIDRSSIEVFVNQGEYTLSSRIYPNENERELSLFSYNGQLKVNKAVSWQIRN